MRRIRRTMSLGSPAAAPIAGVMSLESNAVSVNADDVYPGTYTDEIDVIFTGGVYAGPLLSAPVYSGTSGWCDAVIRNTGAGYKIGLSITPAGSTPAGSHTATYTVTDGRATGGPLTFVVTLVVAAAVPVMSLSEDSYSTTQQVGAGNPATLVSVITNSGTGTLAAVSAAKVGGASWISLAVSGTGNNQSVSAVFDVSALGAGTHTETIRLTSAGASNSPQDITVSITLTAVAIIQLSQSAIPLSMTAGGTSPTPLTIDISNAGSGTLATASVSKVGGATWLSVLQSGSGNTQSITVNFSAGSLAAGTYTETIRTTCAGASNSPQDTTITLVVSAVVSGYVAAATLIRVDGGSGSVLVSNGFPCPPGYLTDADIAARKPAVFVAGVEQSCHVKALEGRHNDGSIRAVRVQFNYNIPNATPIVAEVRMGTVRSTTDISETPMTFSNFYSGTGTSMVIAVGLLLPTDTTYLTQSFITFQPLLPAANDGALALPVYQTKFASRFNYLKTIGLGYRFSSAPATYEYWRALAAQWCRTGTTEYLTNAMLRMRFFSDYLLGTTGYTPTINVEGISSSVCVAADIASNGQLNQGVPGSEAHSLWPMSSAMMYLLTGIPQYKIFVNAAAQRVTYDTQAKAINTDTGYIDNIYHTRFNIGGGRGQYAVLAAALIDATRPQNNPSGAGRSKVNATELPWLIDCANARRWTNKGYRDGMSGVAQTVNNPWLAANLHQVGDTPTFQLSISTSFWIDYYNNIKADNANIPALVKGTTDAYLQEVVSLRSGDVGFTDGALYGVGYGMDDTPGRDPTRVGDFNGASCFSLPMMGHVFAWLANFYPTDVVNGATYAVWAQRAIQTYNMGSAPYGNWTWKAFGEVFGFTMAASYYLTVGAFAGPTTIRNSTVYSAWPT